MSDKSFLATVAANVNRLPEFSQPYILTKFIAKAIPFIGTSGVVIEILTSEKVVTSIPNKKAVRNHIGGVHAAATALLAESASGLVTAMNLPKSSLPLLKSMHVDYKKPASGNLRAEAVVSASQIKKMQNHPSGNIAVSVTITDEQNQNPSTATMTWAWISREKKDVA